MRKNGSPIFPHNPRFYFLRDLGRSRRADLNRWPADYESAALPAELRRQKNAHPLGVSNSGKEKKDQEPRKIAGSKLLVPVNVSRGVGVVNELILALRNPFISLVLFPQGLPVLLPSLICLSVTP